LASDFEFTGVFNGQSNFRERATGMAYTLPAPFPEDSAVELLDGDEVVIPTPQIYVYSIRERRVIRYSR
jgi:hypothetical protein